jgi:hypothetical protein
VQRRNSIILWDVAARQPIATLLDTYPVGIEDLGFVDARTLVSSASDGLGVWDVAARRRLGRPLAADTFEVEGTALSLSGVVVSVDCSAMNSFGFCDTGNGDRITVWNVSRQSWPGVACEIARRDLTPEERHTYLGGGTDERALCSDVPATTALPATASPRTAT